MICLKFGLPLIRGAQGSAIAFDPAWLRDSLAHAARRAGYPGWWQVDDLVEGIALYFRHDYPSSVIDLAKLEHIVRSVLCDVGYHEVALRFQTAPPFHRVSLARFLRELSRNDRTEFFEKLSALIAGLHDANVRHFHFSDVHACVHGLKSIQPPPQDGGDHHLLEKLIAFVRERIQAIRCDREVWCAIS